MTDKERLEEITSSVGILLSGDRHVLLRRKHYEWLIEQTERVNELETTVDFYESALRDADRRVQELEEEVDRLKVWYGAYHRETKTTSRLRDENKRLREALEEIMKIQENHEWNLYGLAYGIAERILFDLEESE